VGGCDPSTYNAASQFGLFVLLATPDYESGAPRLAGEAGNQLSIGRIECECGLFECGCGPTTKTNFSHNRMAKLRLCIQS